MLNFLLKPGHKTMNAVSCFTGCMGAGQLVKHGKIITPLEIDVPYGDTIAEQYLLFLGNREYYLECQKDPHTPPVQKCTTRDETVTLTLPIKACPFIISEQPSDYRGICT